MILFALRNDVAKKSCNDRTFRGKVLSLQDFYRKSPVMTGLFRNGIARSQIKRKKTHFLFKRKCRRIMRFFMKS